MCSPWQRGVPGAATVRRRLNSSPSSENFSSAPGNCRKRSEDTCRPSQTATCVGRCVFTTFPVLNVEVGYVLPPVVDLYTLHPAPQRREGLIGESGNPTCFHWNKGTPWLYRRSGSNSRICPLCSILPFLSLPYTHTYTNIQLGKK
ncbi:hypothetical protein CRENBAI_016376 [Crenichthys baileyi]|uniref:Uncharacterized protein n=1 Tax=Crenichthys baileyi TaxID=28760 RepID=A0AAV9R608_9TELE